MSGSDKQTEHPMDHLPDEVQEQVSAGVSADAVRAAAPFDLDAHGKYIEGYLVLADDRLGEFVRDNGQWRAHWVNTADLSEAKIVEGLGMSLLRLLSDGRNVREIRFTRRHAKAVARLHRRLERLIGGKDEDGEPLEEPKRPGEKKLRCEKCGRVIPAWSEDCPACLSRRKILFRLLDFVKPYKGRAILGLVLSLSLLGLQLTLPYLSRPMLDRGLGSAPGLNPDWGFFLTMWALMASLVVAMAVGAGLQQRLMAGLGSRVARDIRQTVYRHLHKLSLSFFARKQTGSLVSRVTHDTERLWDFIAFTVVEVSTSMLMLVGVTILLFLLHWKLAIFVLMPVPIMVGLTVFFHKRMHTVFHRIFHRWAQMTAVIGDALPGVRVIKAFSQEGREVDRFNDRSGRVYDEEMKMINIWTTFGPVMRFCTQVGTLIIWVLGGWWAIQNFRYVQVHGVEMPGGMTVGSLMAFTGYMNLFYRPIHMIAHMDRMFNRAATSAQRIFEVLDTQPAIFSKAGARRPENIGGAIELRNVSFSYDGIRRVLKNVSLKIEPGTMVGLAGPSGGGKTTLVNLICRFYDVLEGQILVDGTDLRDYDIKALRGKIGVVLQEPFLFHGTVVENVAYGNPDATLDQIIESTKAANAHDFIVGFPDGYDTLVGERGHSLSGGERQRISIARAILGNPEILILDEATSSVDTETEKLIQEALDRLVADRTTIAIAHRLSTLRKADRLVILEKGVVIEEGSHEELSAKADGLYAKLLRMQSETHSVMGI